MMRTIAAKELQTLSEQAAKSSRKRVNLNLHPALDDQVQRFFNAIEPGSYVRPHRHDGAERWELFLIVKGSAMIISFDTQGRIIEKVVLSAAHSIGVEIPGNTWHTVMALEPNTILYETKQGPYKPSADKDFAPWAPREADAHCVLFMDWFQHGNRGAMPPELL